MPSPVALRRAALVAVLAALNAAPVVGMAPLRATAMAAQLQREGHPPALPTGRWRAWLDSPGGELPFGLELRTTETADPQAWPQWHATLVNGPERIPVPEVAWTVDVDGALETWWLELRFPHYDSVIRAQPHFDGGGLTGTWTKRSATGTSALPFWAMVGSEHRFAPRSPADAPDPPPLAPRWRVDFARSEDDAVGMFETVGARADGAGQRVHGTFLTTTGDYRYLAGTWDAAGLRLSCFDGAHAFLFHAHLADARLRGTFWSRDTWEEGWTAVADDAFRPPDPWQTPLLKPAADRPDWRSLRYVPLDAELLPPDADPETTRIRLDDPRLAGRARLLVLFGSWCPNCHDAHAFLKELHARYADAGLAITSLGFELTDDRARNLAQLRRYDQVMELPWPVLLAADSADKKNAAQAFPLLTEVRAYPTFVFLDADGAIDGVYSGFSGPATGAAHERLRAAFDRRVRRLLELDG